MKKSILVNSVLFVFILLIGFIANAQESNECKVLLESISGSYNGDCKNGLAHGKGIAQGIDKYEGKFKEGFPNGNGKYFWANGDYYEGNWKAGKKNGRGTLYVASTDKKLNGIWKDDNFEREIVELPYKVIQMLNVTSVTIMEKQGGIPGSIEVVFNRDGREVRDFNDLLLSNNSGVSTKSITYSGFEGVTFPFEGSLQFTALNRLNTFEVKCNVKFIIIKEGSWKVIVKY
ncbi:MAG: hypothetical protein A2W99_00960 [Bacteroidetes bacterium GWF2_33_16]|nr:MAG: hypothetical protein A2X00_03665 [Bacteroidetes bacterium GWE2_32_14]OFY08832.1 MAG: hypothetical protein A2W99_00960 [Bacteroidetes bacterium GWF2_33_16]